MTTIASRTDPARPVRLPPPLDRRFEAVVFDWDAAAAPDRGADPGALPRLVEELSTHGLDLALITGTDVGDLGAQLGARPAGPGHLYFCVNRGSEVFEADADGLRRLDRREATATEEAALDTAAAATVAELGRLGVAAELVSRGPSRRTIDLIPEPEWAKPPKARTAELRAAVEERLHRAGLAGLRGAVELAVAAAREAGLDDPRVSSDAKHVEIGLTDKADSARWAFSELARRGIGARLVLVVGDAFGPLGGLIESDPLLPVGEANGATVVSVADEPRGAPAEVLSMHGGPALFLRLLSDQLERRRRGDLPELDGDPDWTLVVDRRDPRLERVEESLLALADGRLGTRGVPLLRSESATPGVVYAGVYAGEGPATALAPCPDWTRLGTAPAGAASRRVLHLRTGLLREESTVTSLRFSSLARPGTVALRAEAKPELLPRGGRRRLGEAVHAAFFDRRRRRIFERLGAYAPDAPEAQAALDAARDAGFERLLSEQREAWAARWEESDVRIEGDGALQQAVRFALFHLMSSVADAGEAAVGARGLSGQPIEGTCSGTAMCSCSHSWPRPIPAPHAQCSSIASAVCPPHAKQHMSTAAREPGSPGSLLATAST